MQASQRWSRWFGWMGLWLVFGVAFEGGKGCVVGAEPRVIPGGLRIEAVKTAKIPFPKDTRDCWPYVSKHLRRPLATRRLYPQTVEEAKGWLQQAAAEKRLFWQPGEIIGRLQTEIDRHQAGDLYLFFGNNHTITQHYHFFNELLHPGKDGLFLEGLTHLAIEAFLADLEEKRLTEAGKLWLKKMWVSTQGRRLLGQDKGGRKRFAELVLSSQQPLIDLYLKEKQRWALSLLRVLNRFMLGRAYPTDFLEEIESTLIHAGRYRGLEVVATDMSLALRNRFYRVTCMVYPLREVFSLQILQRRLSKKKRNVIAYMWGADHIRQGHLPRFLSPTIKTVSIRLEGGGKPGIWDQAAKELGLPLKHFALLTPGAEDADMMIHFPPVGPWQEAVAGVQGVSKARIVRKPGAQEMKLSPAVFTHYTALIARSLEGYSEEIGACAEEKAKGIRVQLWIDKRGRVSKVSLLEGALGWSKECLQKILWKQPMPPPPQGQSHRVILQITRARDAVAPKRRD